MSQDLNRNPKSLSSSLLKNDRALKLHQKFITQVQTERKITHEILLTIQEFDITKCFLELGYSSLFDYLIKGHGYSASAAHRRISSARLLKQAPEVAVKIQEGKINLSQLALAQSAIMQEEKAIRLGLRQNESSNQEFFGATQNTNIKSMKSTEEQRKEDLKKLNQKKIEILKSIEGKSGFETQKILLENFQNFELPKPKVTPTKTKKVQVSLEFNEDDWNKIQGLINHMSHKVSDQKLESLLLYWATQIEQKKQKVSASLKSTEKAQKARVIQGDGKKIKEVQQAEVIQGDQKRLKEAPPARKQSVNSLPLRKWSLEQSKSFATIKDSSVTTTRKYISVNIKNQIFQKAQHQCEYQSSLTGERCQSQKFLDIDHIHPLALGGSNDSANLRVLCRAHNHLAAKQMNLLSCGY